MQIGDKINKLTILSEPYRIQKAYGKLTVIKCRCDCGKEIEVRKNLVKNRKQISCGCYQKEIASKTHKKYKQGKPSSYSSWCAMKQRCTNKNTGEYKNYGGRGISYDPKWETFEGFYEDMGEKPKNKSLDRINNNLNYNKENCVWATPVEQGRNRRCAQSNIDEQKLREIISDLPTMSMKDIANKYDISPSLVSSINFAWESLETLNKIKEENTND